MNEITIALTGLFCTVVSGIVTFLLTKRKYNTEVESQEIQNMESAFEAYKKITNDSIKRQEDQITALQKENSDLRVQIGELQSQITHQQEQMLHLLNTLNIGTAKVMTKSKKA